MAAWCKIDFEDWDANPLYYADNLYLNGKLVTDVVIPDGVTKISDYLLSCNSLTSVTIPDSVTSIGGYAFNRCSNLTSVTIPDSVTSIGDSAFRYCSSLASVTIPDSVTSIGNWVFSGCSNLKKIDVNGNNKQYCSIDGVLFDKNKTKLICYPAGKPDSTYTIPDSVTSIGETAFCLSLIHI